MLAWTSPIGEREEELGLDEDALARFRRDNVGIVFQSFHLIATMTALENVAVPLEFRGLDDAFARSRAAVVEALAASMRSQDIQAMVYPTMPFNAPRAVTPTTRTQRHPEVPFAWCPGGVTIQGKRVSPLAQPPARHARLPGPGGGHDGVLVSLRAAPAPPRPRFRDQAARRRVRAAGSP